MLLKRNESDGSWGNMHVSRIAALALFGTDIVLTEDGDYNDGDGKIIVTYRVPLSHPERDDVKTLEIPLRPETHDLEEFTVLMHSSPTMAFAMPERYNAWFSERFGFTVRLAYLGECRRPVLGNFMPGEALESEGGGGGGWLSSITRNIPYFRGGKKEENRILTFADLAPYLVISQTSLENVSSRLPEGEIMDVTKFRPNIVVSGAETAYDEDYWAELTVRDIRLTVTNNCARCVSINVDYDTGMPGTGEAGSILKKMMKDRRVDPGQKWSPIFGRYGFLNDDPGEGLVLRVGDGVEVTGRNAERTVFGKLCLSIDCLCLMRIC